LQDTDRASVLELTIELGVPILLGSPHLEAKDTIFNSAFLVPDDGSAPERYDKVRLVSFGEYIPWRAFFDLIGLEKVAYSMGVGDFSAGDAVSVFDVKGTKLSPLICFEDTFPSLSRRARNKGAELIVVITNDAWFGQSGAPYQHLQASVFRAIENGIPIVRAANTGVSAFVLGDGKVVDRVKNENGYDTFVMGGLVRSIRPGGSETTYVQFGYWFPVICLGVLVFTLMVTLKKREL